jgi:hypothetical protein
VWWQGIAAFTEARGQEEAKRRKKAAAQVLPDLQGNGLVRQRSISTDLIYSSIICF